MTMPLMRKATAAWLIQNTILTFQQIADFCGMHVLEIQGMADEEVDRGIIPVDPIISGQLTREEIARVMLMQSSSSLKKLCASYRLKKLAKNPANMCRLLAVAISLEQSRGYLGTILC
jgi:hypothetical protein